MTAYRFFWYYLWIAPHLLLLFAVNVMIVRRIYREFPMFFMYACFEVLQFAALWAMQVSPAISAEQYAYAHWLGMAVSTALRFGIIHEIFIHLFKSYPALEALGRLLFRWTSV